jgi:hypothetical protein
VAAVDAWYGLQARSMAWPGPATWAPAAAAWRPALAQAGSILFHAAVTGRSRARCLFFGHDDRFSRTAGRLSLRCDECGRHTAGWAIGTAGLPAVARASTGRVRRPRSSIEVPS